MYCLHTFQKRLLTLNRFSNVLLHRSPEFILVFMKWVSGPYAPHSRYSIFALNIFGSIWESVYSEIGFFGIHPPQCILKKLEEGVFSEFQKKN